MTPFDKLVAALETVQGLQGDSELEKLRVYPVVKPPNKKTDKRPYAVYTPVSGVNIDAFQGTATLPVVQFDVFATTFQTAVRVMTLSLEQLQRRGVLASSPDAPRMDYFDDVNQGLFRYTVDLELNQ